MKLLIDLSYIENLHNGVALYAFRILKGMRDNGVKDICLFLNPKTAEIVQNEFPSYAYVIAPKIEANLINKVWYRRLVTSYNYSKIINKMDCEIVFTPFSDPFYFWKIRKKHVRTIHDLQELRVYSRFWIFCGKIFVPIKIKNSDALITISDFVKQDVLKKYKFAAKKNIKKIYAPIDVNRQDTLPLLDFRYILCVNTLAEYKNVMTLLKAFEEIKDSIPHKLVLVGGVTSYLSDVIKPYITDHNLENRVVHFNKVTDNELKSLYQHTSLFVTPSLQEGFGATPIEAALCNTPVISSKETALYESTMGLLNYYEPAMDHQALATKIMEVLQNPPSQEELEKISSSFKEQYNNRKIAKEVYEFITSVYEG
ncbi:glycosyltransferase involved in cell wall biosynthesis [Parabacteroides sp. PFB2-10]|uniref:glycosyltransferase family 4 protein n=1 Tax=Parabacteroides sp. PFB2-10 TaxID=1742405 RepID=UPI002474B9FF|nr:glycosyltransferase family 1 protein [Parabacteroides sp. PFB2-10]MDH6314012.1 glycosyltransferase involved in cell wall biosynthesis [Parabacteroides sp. PFB2-10]MDL2244643.1 glycosyltransferase family 4 protein [Parabacteroides sp. OttesenSCG-928-J18]